jgi:hypothetical protein
MLKDITVTFNDGTQNVYSEIGALDAFMTLERFSRGDGLVIRLNDESAVAFSHQAGVSAVSVTPSQPPGLPTGP